MVVGVSGRPVGARAACDRIRARVRDVHAGRAEPDARHRRGEHHRPARLDVARVRDGAAQEAAAVLQRLGRPDVGDRVGALVWRALVRRRRPRTLAVGTRQVGLGGVADHVDASRRDHLRGGGAGQLGVDDRLRRAQVPVRDPGLDAQRGDVEHGHGRRLRARPGRRRDREVGLQRRGRPPAPADRWIDVVHHGRRVRDDEVRDLGGVDRRAAADRDEPVHAGVAREPGRLLERLQRRLHAGAVEIDDGDARRLDRRPHLRGVARRSDPRIGHEQRARDAQAGELPARVGGRARPELDRRGLEREDRLTFGHASRSSAARSGAGNGTGRRVARSTNTCTNHPVAVASSSPALNTASS